MLKRITNLLKGNIFIIAVAITLFIAYLSLMRMPKIQLHFSYIDKVYHLIAYFTLSVSWLFAYYKKVTVKYIIVFLCIIYGILIEILQGKLTAYRTADYNDAIANTLGVLLGFIIFNQILKKNEDNLR